MVKRAVLLSSMRSTADDAAGSGVRLRPPAVRMHELVEMTGDDAGHRDCVEHREHANLGHQALQFANVCRAVSFEVVSDAEERQKSREQEEGAEQDEGRPFEKDRKEEEREVREPDVDDVLEHAAE